MTKTSASSSTQSCLPLSAVDSCRVARWKPGPWRSRAWLEFCERSSSPSTRFTIFHVAEGKAMRTWLDSICPWSLASPWPIGICRVEPQAGTTGLYWCRLAIIIRPSFRTSRVSIRGCTMDPCRESLRPLWPGWRRGRILSGHQRHGKSFPCFLNLKRRCARCEVRGAHLRRGLISCLPE